MPNFVEDPNKWRLSKSGFSIKTGWNNEKQIIAKFAGCTAPLDKVAFEQWLENARIICDLYNATLDVTCPGCRGRKVVGIPGDLCPFCRGRGLL